MLAFCSPSRVYVAINLCRLLAIVFWVSQPLYNVCQVLSVHVFSFMQHDSAEFSSEYSELREELLDLSPS